MRIFGHEGPIYTFRDPEVGRRYTRSWAGEVWVEEARRVVPLAFNREGMRDRDWPEDAGGLPRVAVLGDSMVAAVGTEEGRRLTAVAARRLESQAGGGGPAGAGRAAPELMAWGVAGSSPALQARLYERRVRRYRPGLVVLAWFEGNDLADDWQPLGGRRQAWMAPGPDGALVHLPLPGPESPFSEWLARHSRLYVWQRRALARLRAGDGEGGAGDGLRPGLRAFDPADAEADRAWAFLRDVLAHLAAQVAADGARLAVLHLPTPEAVADDLWAEVAARARALERALEREGPERRLLALARGLALPVASAGPALRARAAADPAARLFFDRRGHLDDDGHALAGEALAELVREALAPRAAAAPTPARPPGDAPPGDAPPEAGR